MYGKTCPIQFRGAQHLFDLVTWAAAGQGTEHESKNLRQTDSYKSRTTRRLHQYLVSYPINAKIYRIMSHKGCRCSREGAIPQRTHAVNPDLRGQTGSATISQCDLAEPCSQGEAHTLVLKILNPDFPCACIVVFTVSIGIYKIIDQ